ncbi:MAG: hypothetical protein M3N17_07835 [Actinomycetota bacterium]|nr:hypothetical protein [Actinomycetota bacterium]
MALVWPLLLGAAAGLAVHLATMTRPGVPLPGGGQRPPVDAVVDEAATLSGRRRPPPALPPEYEDEDRAGTWLGAFVLVLVATCLYLDGRPVTSAVLAGVAVFGLGFWLAAVAGVALTEVRFEGPWTTWVISSLGLHLLACASLILVSVPLFEPQRYGRLLTFFERRGCLGLVDDFSLDGVAFVLSHMAGIGLALWVVARLTRALAHVVSAVKAVNGAAGHTVWLRVSRATVGGARSGRRLALTAALGLVSLLLCSGLVFSWLAPLSDVSRGRPGAGAAGR